MNWPLLLPGVVVFVCDGNGVCVCVCAVYTCKLSEEERPLFLRLVAGPCTDALSFVLKEQQTGEVLVSIHFRFLSQSYINKTKQS